jgi:hypothetical protein
MAPPKGVRGWHTQDVEPWKERRSRWKRPKVYRRRCLRSLGKKIGSAEKLFVNESHEPEYNRVRIGLFGLKSVLIPVGVIVIDEEYQTLVLE